MRKSIVDGSVTSGFQRSMLLSTRSGFVETSKGKVRISEVLLEEDSARIIEQGKGYIVFRLDRLGIPEVEIGTYPEIKDPEHARETALKIGQIIRATGKAKTGLGTVRQDVNVSIRGGARTEIKHIQRLSLIPKVLKSEVKRQLALIEIKKELKKRKIRSETLDSKIYDVSTVFKRTKSKLIKKGLKKVYALRLAGFSGLLSKEIQPNHSFGKEIADILKVKLGLGIIHTDELPRYGITKKEVEELRKEVEAKEKDCVVLIIGTKTEAKKAAEEIIERAKQALKGVPKEVRRALPDGTTQYLRPLPGAARLYPETDLLPIVITEKRIEEIKKNLPELPSEIKKRLGKYGLSKKLADQLANSEWLYSFERIVREIKVDPTLVASTFEYTLTRLEREGIPVGNLIEEHFFRLFKALKQGKIIKEIIPDLLAKISKNPASIDQIISEVELVSKKELEKIIDQIVEEKKEFIMEKGKHALKPLMGLVMEKVKGKVSGKLVSEILREKIVAVKK